MRRFSSHFNCLTLALKNFIEFDQRFSNARACPRLIALHRHISMCTAISQTKLATFSSAPLGATQPWATNVLLIFLSDRIKFQPNTQQNYRSAICVTTMDAKLARCQASRTSPTRDLSRVYICRSSLRSLDLRLLAVCGASVYNATSFHCEHCEHENAAIEPEASIWRCSPNLSTPKIRREIPVGASLDQLEQPAKWLSSLLNLRSVD